MARSRTQKQILPATDSVNKKGFPFTRLSPELRNRIYYLTLVQEEPIDLTSTNGDGYAIHLYTHHLHTNNMSIKKESWVKTRIQAMVYQPAITRLLRSIRKESLPIFYGANTFLTWSVGGCSVSRYSQEHVTVSEATEAWLLAIGCENRAMLARLYFEEGKPALQTLRKWTIKDVAVIEFVKAEGKARGRSNVRKSMRLSFKSA